MAEHLCTQCDKTFKRRGKVRYDNPFCSPACYRQYRAENGKFKKEDILYNLTLLEYYTKPTKHGGLRQFWTCKCTCGKIRHYRQDYLTNKKLNKNDNGCKHCYKAPKGKNDPKYKGCNDLSHGYFQARQKSAYDRGLKFNITIQDAWNQFEKQNKICIYSNRPLTMDPSNKRNTKKQTASLDRLDSNLGYTIDNIQWVHKSINIMKNSLPENEFLGIIEEIYNYRIKPS